MPSVDSNSSYSSSDSSTSSLSSPRLLLTDIRQQQQQAIQYDQHQMRTTNSSISQITQSHICVTRYKTELCRPFTETGKCKYGDKCQFSHGIKELRILMRHPKYKTEYCRTFHTTGYCPYGPRCHFIHDIHEARTTTNTNDTTMRRHSDIRSNQLIQKSTTRNRITSDYKPLSPSHIITNSSSSKTPFSFQEINRALLSYENNGNLIQQQYQQQQNQQQKQEFYSSILSTMTNSLTHRTFSLSSSSNSSLAPQYV
ncbi:unnamed protein product [Rotaria sp. Silwood2]|nr:unnamed protein product [Rotaria sp. Silwood2]CAF2682614.1 unnamed protein product [Rotaria sp. Silwood2]CAF2879319.1 unnamed protein product [Rotaria sp. Silwood2]CAF3068010.1 unnamed protein product [Rotaria sp. Silwood2]CAF4064990.1 unnamed protein product [Rotaria sp. Silwood2]